MRSITIFPHLKPVLATIIFIFKTIKKIKSKTTNAFLGKWKQNLKSMKAVYEAIMKKESSRGRHKKAAKQQARIDNAKHPYREEARTRRGSSIR